MAGLNRFYYNLMKIKNRILQGKPVLVFMYHRVDNTVDKHLSKLTVSVNSFEEQLIYFKNNFDCLRLTDDWSDASKTAVLLTFDDGYMDNFHNVLPLLEKYNVPATIFITTQNIGLDDEFWWDRLAADYSACKESFSVPGLEMEVSKAQYTYRTLSAQLVAMKEKEKGEWFEDFEKSNKILFASRKEFRTLTKEELSTLSKHRLIDIGLHTHHHYPLGTLSYEEQKEELLLSITKLKALVPDYINFLSLPHGSSNERTIKVCNELNIKAVLLANDNYSSSANKSSKRINRIIMPDLKGKFLKDYVTHFSRAGLKY
jgi:peptidoglycan/xylan/chitin deacetylase (PgdA/CDA1 family)